MFKEEQQREFDIHAERMVRWLRANGHPHMSIIIDQTHAELVEGQMAVSVPFKGEAQNGAIVGAGPYQGAPLQGERIHPQDIRYGALQNPKANAAIGDVMRHAEDLKRFNETMREAKLDKPPNVNLNDPHARACIEDHPLYEQFTQAIMQAMYGKGVRHGGAVTPFLDQPWIHYAHMHGIGFLTGQAAKKLEEAASTKTGDAFVNEIRGAVVYLGMALIYHEELEVKKLTAGLQKQKQER